MQSQVNIRTPERMLDFNFDSVFHSGATQGEVYASVKHVVLGVMEGYNATLLAYGQTSSGKTHTMMGKPSQEGVIPRAVAELFDAVANSRESLEFTFKGDRHEKEKGEEKKKGQAGRQAGRQGVNRC